MKKFLQPLAILALISVVSAPSHAQVYPFPTDELQQGYYNRPYQRYEAEPDFCTLGGNASFLSSSDDQRDLQSEASHQQAAQLSGQGDYVAWTVNRPGDGLTIRFSLPDNAEGTGMQGTMEAYVGDEQLGTITLDSRWAWQYCDGNYPDNNPRTGNVVIRMRFDETHLRLNRSLQSGEVLRLVKTTADDTPYTIDFAELEQVPAEVMFDDLQGNKVQFDGQGDIGDFIEAHLGQIIYVPAGRWNCNKRIYLRGASAVGTQIIGAGMWYSEIYFAASSEDRATYDKRGFEVDKGDIRIEGLYLNTVNRQRYFQNNDSKQVGKAFMGTWGTNSVIRNCWAEHFECGAWIADYPGSGSRNLLVEHCRFRNNYADGFNCAHGCEGHTIRYCSFRNNGDDDMASWTTARMCKNITYEYCTAENNWRASSLGFFGGSNHHAHHLHIVDALECGARANADFDGVGFDAEGMIRIHDITIEHCGCVGGTKGRKGDFWGNAQAAFNIGGTSKYTVRNVSLSNVRVLNSRGNGIMLKAQTGKPLSNIRLEEVTIDGADYGIYFSAAIGDAMFCNVVCLNCTTQDQSAHMPTMVISDCETALEDLPVSDLFSPADSSAACFDLLGRPVCADYQGLVICNGHLQLM